MRFVDRKQELARLQRLARRPAGGLAVIWGRRRVGKTRLLLEWCRGGPGLYTVADRSAEPVQRRYLALAAARTFEGFSAVEYPDWRSLLEALSRAATASRWRGPLVIDELPYLVEASPALPSVLQRWIDHQAREAGLAVALAGSAQHMMHGLVLDARAPLYGRAAELMRLSPLAVPDLGRALGFDDPVRQIRAYAFWGGVPRYWELAEPFGDDLESAVDELVLSPLGPLHMEPDRVLSAEIPAAVSLGPLLDALGAGAHRVVEIGGRTGQPSTSLSRPLSRLVELGLVVREQPFGEHERGSKRTLYRIDDPFLRAWYRLVAPRRAELARAGRRQRLAIMRKHAAQLTGGIFERLCREAVPFLGPISTVCRALEGFGVAGRYWEPGGPEWDVVAVDEQRGRLLLGEVKWSERPVDGRFIRRAADDLAKKGRPRRGSWAGLEIVRAVFVPRLEAAASDLPGETLVVTAGEVVEALDHRR